MQKRIILVMCFMMLVLTACEKTTAKEKKDDNKSKENVHNQTGDENEILVKTEYGNYIMDAEWFVTQEISSDYEGFAHCYTKPDSGEKSNVINISYYVIPEYVDMSDHDFRINEKLEFYQNSELYNAETISVEDYDCENQDEVFLFTFIDNKGEVITREYIILKGQVLFSVNENISSRFYASSKQEQAEINDVSGRIVKRALESFQWID